MRETAMGAEREAQTATVAELLTAAGDRSGALWRLRGAERQLDANLVRHPPGAEVAAHTEAEVDVMLVVVAGDGVLTLDGAPSRLHPGFLGLLPRAVPRALSAGPEGLAVLTVHRRRRGMTIGRLPPDPSGSGSASPSPEQCALHLVCGQCHRHAIEATARYCSGCGTPLVPRPEAG